MKIIYLIDQLLAAGGIERVVCLKANYLVNKGYEIYIVSCTKPEEREKILYYLDPRVKLIPLNLPGVSKKILKQVLQRYTEIFDEIQPDIVIAAGRQSIMHAAKIKDGSKKIIEHHGSLYRRKYRWATLRESVPGKFLLKILFHKDYQVCKEYDQVIVLTEEDKNDRLLYPFKRIDVIPNPVSFQAEEPSSLTRKRIIAIGRLDKQKAFHHLINIWGKVEKEYPDWILSIFGNGEKKEQLKKLVQELGIENRIEFCPPTPYIKEEILNSSILCMTSRYEGSPMVIIEAMGCGVPPVTFAFKCGPRDVITNGVNGFYSEMNDTDGFICNLKLLMDDESLRRKIGQAGYEESNKYSIERIMPQWVDLFDELMKEKRMESN